MGMFHINTKDGMFMFNLIANNYGIVSTSKTYTSMDNEKIRFNGVRNNCTVHVNDQTLMDQRFFGSDIKCKAHGQWHEDHQEDCQR